MNNSKPVHIAWMDLLRVTACFLVVLAHCCDPFVAQFDNNRYEFLSGTFWGSLVRPCVPLFVMMSGILLLPVKTTMTEFYSRRMKRIVIPLIFWSLLSPLFYYLYLHSGIQTSSPNIVLSDHTLPATLSKLITFVFNFSYSTIPLWYLYMLVGLYFFMPILSAWLNSASAKDIRIFLIIWIVSMVVPYIQMVAPFFGYVGNYGNMGIFGVCDWNPYGTFYYFSGFIGYLVLAYYMVKYPLNLNWSKTLSVALPLFGIGYAITSFGFIYTQDLFPGNYAMLEIIWYFSGINVFMMTFAIFIVMQKFAIKNSSFLTKMASYTFGIYLCHFFLVQVTYDVFYKYTTLPPYVMIPLIALCTFTLATAVTSMLMSNRITRRIV